MGLSVMICVALQIGAQPQPDTGLIAFVKSDKPLCEPDAKSDIWVVKADGTDLKQLTTSGECASPYWTPDGKRIMFTSQGQVWIMNADGTGKRRLTQLKGWSCSLPAVSSDGKKVVFTADKELNDTETMETLRTMNIDGSGLTTIASVKTEFWTAFSHPVFSPDGTSILYVEHGSDPVSNLYLFSLRTKRKRLLYGPAKHKNHYSCFAPVFSPDGKQIACHNVAFKENGATDEKRSGIVIMRSDGTSPKLFPAGDVDGHTWSPDGQKVVFATEEGLWLLDLKTGQKQIVLRTQGTYSPAWQPIARKTSAASVQQPTQQTVMKVQVKPVKCDCANAGVHGNVHIVYSDGKDETVTKEGNCVSGDSTTAQRVGPKVSPDCQTVGWLAGEHLNDDGEKSLYATKLVLYRNGRVVRTIIPGRFIRGWQFWSEGNQAIIYSGGGRGPGVYELYDIATGRAVAKCDDPLDENAPEWAKRLR